MLLDSESRFNVLKKWLSLTGFRGMDDDLLAGLVEYGVIVRPSDLYKLTERHLLTIPDLDYDDAYAILESAEKCRNVGMARALVALVSDVELDDIRKICSSPCSIPELLDRFKGSSDLDFLSDELDRLMQVGVDLSFSSDDPVFDELTTTPLTGKVVAVSGILSAERDIVKSALESFGAKVTSKVTKETDLLLAGEGAGEDMELAIKIGVKIISEAEVASMLGMTE